MIEKVISGGQIGADWAGLVAARALGIKTGGTCPKGWRTLRGARPRLAEFGVVEHESWQYVPRTRENARNSDGTMRFAYNWGSPGERATIREVRAAGKPCFDVTINLETGEMTPPPEDAIAWARKHNVRVLNVAGNGDEQIEILVVNYLTRVLVG